MATIHSRLAAMGVELPSLSAPQANYIPARRSGGLVFISGQVSIFAGNRFVGKVGRDLDMEGGRLAARTSALNALAALQAEIGDLERVVQFVKVTGFVNCAADFTEPQQVVNGASDLFVEVFGERGRHARSSMGVNALPLGCAVEVEIIVEVA